MKYTIQGAKEPLRKSRQRSTRPVEYHANRPCGASASCRNYNGAGQRKQNRNRDRFVTDYELAVLAKILGVSMEWLTENE